MPVDDVVALSASDGEEPLIPEPPPLRQQKRKRSFAGVSIGEQQGKKSVDPEIRLGQLLGSRCKCKKRDCFREFSEKDIFSKLLKYRNEYFSLHKLDQDHVVPVR